MRCAESTADGTLPAVPRPSRGGRWRLLPLRLLHVTLGLALFGFSLACMLRSGVGLGPWDVFHEGLASRTSLSVGRAIIVTGFALLAFSALVARIAPGLGTVMNMVQVGLWVDVFLTLLPAPTLGREGAALFAAGLLLNGAATGLYLSAGLGPGPRDGFVLGLVRLFSTTVTRARTLVELGVLALGWALGGTVGAGTIVFALTIGPLMQAGLRLSRPLERGYARLQQAQPGAVGHG
jgi:uncharacterized membrane protein YczE